MTRVARKRKPAADPDDFELDLSDLDEEVEDFEDDVEYLEDGEDIDLEEETPRPVARRAKRRAARPRAAKRTPAARAARRAAPRARSARARRAPRAAAKPTAKGAARRTKAKAKAAAPKMVRNLPRGQVSMNELADMCEITIPGMYMALKRLGYEKNSDTGRWSFTKSEAKTIVSTLKRDPRSHVGDGTRGPGSMGGISHDKAKVRKLGGWGSFRSKAINRGGKRRAATKPAPRPRRRTAARRAPVARRVARRTARRGRRRVKK